MDDLGSDRPLSGLEQLAFAKIKDSLRPEAPADGWDPVPRTREIVSQPLGHIAFKGDFTRPGQ